MNNDPTKIFFFEDHPLMILGIRALIGKEDDLVLSGYTSDAQKLVSEIESAGPDLIVLDVTLYTPNRLDLIRDLAKRFPECPIILLSVHKEESQVAKALEAGAKGYVLKVEEPERLLDAIRAAIRGESYVSQNLRPDPKGGASEARSPIDLLSKREFRILQQIGKGRNNRQIAEEMKMPVKTVEAETIAIQDKLDLDDPAELLQFAVHWVHHEGGFS